MQRVGINEIRTLDRVYDFFEPGQLLEGRAPDFLKSAWDEARTDSFLPRLESRQG